MDHQTVVYYQKNYQQMVKVYDQVIGGISDHFLEAFSGCKRVLEVGFGSGRDLLRLKTLGFECYGVDPVQPFIDHLLQKEPAFRGRLFRDQLPDLIKMNGMVFDGILCSAVLMHLKIALLPDVFQRFNQLLNRNGRLLISIPGMRKDVDGDTLRDCNGRYFSGVTTQQLNTIAQQNGFQPVLNSDHHDALRRKMIWYQLLFQKN